MEYALIVGLILVNVGWLVFQDRQEKRQKDERRELLNRVAEPEMVVPPDEVVEANIKNSEIEPFEPADSFEYAGVGMVSPDLARGDDE